LLKKKSNKEKSSDFFDKVYELVEQIPFGKVTTYGALAEACGIKSAARTVGWAMNVAHGSNLPCHRVVNRNGDLTGKLHFGDPNLMRDLLESEGVKFNERDQVIMKEYLWIPPKSTRKKSRT
jgi:methylated-DNA-protein-cysteine methyltransferase-like protein